MSATFECWHCAAQGRSSLLRSTGYRTNVSSYSAGSVGLGPRLRRTRAQLGGCRCRRFAGGTSVGQSRGQHDEGCWRNRPGMSGHSYGRGGLGAVVARPLPCARHLRRDSRRERRDMEPGSNSNSAGRTALAVPCVHAQPPARRRNSSGRSRLAAPGYFVPRSGTSTMPKAP